MTFQQLRLIKKDMQLRSERSAKEKAIEACESYLVNYIPLSDAAYQEFKSKKLSYNTELKIGNFTKQSIPKEHLAKCVARFKTFSWQVPLNRLESIASIFISGVGDEQTAFQIIGRTYCENVGSYYDLISACRDENIKTNEYWNNIVKLYLLWHPRLTKAELEFLKRQTEQKISVLPDKFLYPHGVDN
ncbi:MAG: hypothetical protein ACXV74_13970 [Methylobacter sp.]